MLADYFLTRFVAFSASCLFSPMRSSCKFVYTRKSVLHVVKSADVQGKVVFSAHSNIKLLLTQVAVCPYPPHDIFGGEQIEKLS